MVANEPSAGSTRWPRPARRARSVRRLHVHAAIALLAAAAAGAGGAPPAVRGESAPQAAPSGGTTYRLVDTWQNRPWALTPGRYGEAADISSAPDGSVYVLDARLSAGRLGAIHVLAPDGQPRRVFVVPGQVESEVRLAPVRLDVALDGTLHVLSQSALIRGGVYLSRVQRLRSDGTEISRFEVELAFPRHYTDIAVRDDGRIYLTRTGNNPWCVYPPPPDAPTPTPTPEGNANPMYSVDVFDTAGVRLDVLAPAALAIPVALDIDRDGTLYVVQRIPPMCDGGPGPGQPTATPRPSVAEGAAPAALPLGIAQASPARDGVLVFEPDHRYRETVPFNGAEDIAVGQAGVFVSRQLEIFALAAGRPPRFQADPLHTAQSGRTYAAFLGRVVFNLDVAGNGRLFASMNHCYFQGVVRFDDPARRPAPAALIGALDAPELEGPSLPIRLAASNGIAVLQGRMRIDGDRAMQPDGLRYYATDYAWEPQTVQRWSRDGGPRAGGTRQGGALTSQLGVCAGSDAWWTRDVAIDGNDVYTVDPQFLERRPDDGVPAWSFWPGDVLEDPDEAAYLTAVDADDGRAVALDAGTNRAVVVSAAGRQEAAWDLDAGGPIGLINDVAVFTDRVYLADVARGRIVARSLDGAAVGEWPTHDGPAAVATGPTGDVFVLGRGSWGFHYRPDGTLLASWPMPDRSRIARDIAVDDDGRVYVSFVVLGDEDPAEPAWDNQVAIEGAGVWVFEPADVPPAAPPPSDGCTARPDKVASPYRIPLGDTVAVTLTVDGRCPGTSRRAQVVVVFDTSRSMGFDDALELGKDAVFGMIGRLDPTLTQLGLVTFDDGATLEVPLTSDLATVRSAVAGLRASGDTQLGGALDAARLELTGPRADDAARRVVVVVTDGVFNDAVFPEGEQAALAAAGVDIWALVFTSWRIEADDEEALLRLITAPGNLKRDPSIRVAEALAARLTGYVDEPGLFEAITVVDVVPDNMRYIQGSSRPPAAFDAVANTLIWTLGRVQAADRIELGYTLQPLEVGTWPTNVEARAPYRDARGQDGELVFPIPEVQVYDDAYVVYLPFAELGVPCVPRTKPRDVVLVIDASSSMQEPAAGTPGTKLEAARAAARVFLERIDLGDGTAGRDRAAIVSFNVAATRNSGLTDRRDGLSLALEGIASAQGTRIDLGLREAADVLGNRRADALPVVILLSDGLQTGGDAGAVLAASEAVRDAAADVVVFTIGLGAQIDVDLLRKVATSADGYYASPSAAQLEEIYQRISARLECEQP